MQYAQLYPEDLTAVPPPETGLVPFQTFLLRQLRTLRLSKRSAPDLLQELLGMFAQRARRSRKHRMWAKPSQRALGARVRHRWGDRPRNLDRCTVNRVLARLTALQVLHMTHRGKIGDHEDPHGWRLSNVIAPGAWFRRQWLLWCLQVQHRLALVAPGTLARTFRRILEWAARRLSDVTSSSRDWEGPPGPIPGKPGEGGPGGLPLPRAGPPPTPPPAIEEVLAEIERIRRDRDW